MDAKLVTNETDPPAWVAESSIARRGPTKGAVLLISRSAPSNVRACVATDRLTLALNELMATSAATPRLTELMYRTNRPRLRRLSRQAMTRANGAFIDRGVPRRRAERPVAGLPPPRPTRSCPL